MNELNSEKDSLNTIAFGDLVTLYSIEENDVIEVQVGSNLAREIESGILGLALGDEIRLGLETFRVQFVEKRRNNLTDKEKDIGTKKLRANAVQKTKTPSKVSSKNTHIIKTGDIVVRTTILRCIKKDHPFEDVTICVNILDKDCKLKQRKMPGYFCRECNQYYMLKEDFKKMTYHGCILCKIVERDFFTQGNKTDFSSTFKKESDLHMRGYNVKEDSQLSQEQRQRLLEILVDEKIMWKAEICDFLDSIIRLNRKNPYMAQAIEKWTADRNHIRRYRPSTNEIGANQIVINKYHKR